MPVESANKEDPVTGLHPPRRSIAFGTALMMVVALALPLAGIARANHGGANSSAVDVDEVQLTPETASMPPGGACVQFTVEAKQSPGNKRAEGETIDITASISDNDNTALITDEVADLTISFCDPDGVGPGTALANTTGPATDDPTPTEAAATIRGECLTDADGVCVFGVSVIDTGTGANSGGSGTVTAWADIDNGNDIDVTEPRDVSTITVGSPVVTRITCTPPTQTRPEGGRAEFQCTARNAAGQPLANVVITGDVISGPNVEETLNFTCTTGAQGTTPAPGANPTPLAPTVGACGYNDAGANTNQSPPGTDSVAFCTQVAAPPGQPNTAGCDPHELQAQGNASATVTWVGGASKISCTPDGATTTPGSSVLITCTVTDVNNQPAPAGVAVTITKTAGPGTLVQNSAQTNAAGQVTANLTTASNESGQATVTGTIGTTAQSGPGVITNCGNPTPGQPNQAPPSGPGAAPAGTVCSDTATVNFTAPTTGPGPGDCADGSDNDGDGEIDLNDAGCRDASDPTEAGPFDSTITIRRSGRRVWTGQVTSPFGRCSIGRRMRLLRNGNVIARDRTDSDGNWRIRVRSNRRPGRYRAVVGFRTLTTASGDQILCNGDRSPVVRVRRR